MIRTRTKFNPCHGVDTLWCRDVDSKKKNGYPIGGWSNMKLGPQTGQTSSRPRPDPFIFQGWALVLSHPPVKAVTKVEIGNPYQTQNWFISCSGKNQARADGLNLGKGNPPTRQKHKASFGITQVHARPAGTFYIVHDLTVGAVARTQSCHKALHWLSCSRQRRKSKEKKNSAYFAHELPTAGRGTCVVAPMPGMGWPGK